MPSEKKEVHNISCDNPACPGNDLDKHDPAGWLFVSAEVYGEPSKQSVFCSASCVSAATGNVATAASLGFAKEEA